jgi:phospholipase/carboxylesterase
MLSSGPLVYQQINAPDCIILSPSRIPTAAVFWLHGLSEDAAQMVPQIEALGIRPEEGIRFVIPQAPLRPLSIKRNEVVRAWFDVPKPESQPYIEDEAGMRSAEQMLRRLMACETDAGIGADRIVIVGFSQGGALGIHTAVRCPFRLAGLVAISSYVVLHKRMPQEITDISKGTPMMLCHGRKDDVIPFELGIRTRNFLGSLGYRIDWNEYPSGHQPTEKHMKDIAVWIRDVLALAPGAGHPMGSFSRIGLGLLHN